MNFNEKYLQPSIFGFGFTVLDIIFKNGNKKPIHAAGGTCANVISNLSYLGWSASIISRIGKDPAGDFILNDLLRSCVNTNYLVRESRVKTPRIIEALKTDEKISSHKFSLRCPKCGTYLPRFRSPTLVQINDLMNTDYTPNVFFFDRISPASMALARNFRENGSVVFFEPNSVKMTDELRSAAKISHIIKFSFDETKDKEDLIKFENELLSCDIEPILIIKTLGKKGVCFKHISGKKWKHQDSYQTLPILDSCGAGDWCSSGFIYALNLFSTNKKIELLDCMKDLKTITQSLKFGQILASISLKYVGARGLSNSLNRKSLLSEIYCSLEPNYPEPLGINMEKKCSDKLNHKIPFDKFCHVCLSEIDYLSNIV